MTRPWRLVALLSATATASYLCRVNVSVAGVMMMRELGLSQQAMGRVFSAFLVGYAICQIPGGMLADRFGAPRVLAWAALAWVAATAWMAGAGASVAALLGARFALGVAEAPTFPAAAQAISRALPAQKRGRANGLVVAAIGLGSAIAPPLISFLMVRIGWRSALMISSLPALAVGLGWLWVRQQTAPVAAALPVAAPSGRPLPRSFLLLTLSYSLQGYVGYIFVFWFYLYLVDVRHFDLLRSALFGSLPWLLSIVSIPMGGWLFDRISFDRRVIPIGGLAGSGVFIAIGAHTQHAYLAAVCLALATALVLSVEGPFWATMTAVAGERSGAGGGVMNMGSNIGGLISPALTPILAASIGWEGALLVSAVLAVVAAILWFWIQPPPVIVEPAA
ncbi:MFS transporter [Paludibaculum fermentans]|uniref:MFS transporter n=1 Tax=Paludibaculum fermentans TaxID=1473598 RepID=A0A7S7SL21_PALFE|nr:MFS transporter [Paludibaculum fermentans]QOY88929.1 MFS transporter [Paludibaculum fermentans]